MMRTNPSFPVLDPTVSVSDLPVAVIGAGPVGLAAAAELAERHIPFIVFDVADDIAGSVREWGHVQLFSPWRYDIAPAARRLLERSGWNAPDPTAHPTGAELIERYLAPLALLPEIAAGIRTNRIVVGISRVGVDKVRSSGRDERPFLITAETPRGPERAVVRAVIDASGTWLSPNPLGADGRPAMGETRAEAWIEVGIPDVLGADRRRYKRRRIAVVGSGHSAQNIVRDLATLSNQYPETRVTWIVRRDDTGNMFGGKADDQLPERGRLGQEAEAHVHSGEVTLLRGFRLSAVAPTEGGVMLIDESGKDAGPFDQIVNATGFRPELGFLREVRVDLDPMLESSRALAPMIDPNVHSCGSVPPHGAAELAHPEANLYIVGAKSYGRAPTFLLATGYEQVRSVVAAIADDEEGAADVRLELPETGVCSLPKSPAPDAGELVRQPESARAELVAASACCD